MLSQSGAGGLESCYPPEKGIRATYNFFKLVSVARSSGVLKNRKKRTRYRLAGERVDVLSLGVTYRFMQK